MKYSEYSKEELKKELELLEKEYKDYQNQNIKINMQRGVPSKEQLSLTMPMLDTLSSNEELISEDGTDCRNYGGLTGIVECKKLFSEMLSVDYNNIIIFGNSSLNIMYNLVSHAYTHGVLGSTPWCKLDKVKWLCPTPGYDRHFAITEYFNIEMINVPLSEDGPDMDMVEKLVENDESIKGIWCVPQYTNPGGIVYSDETIKRLANLNPKAKDFRIYYDNAYHFHHLYDDHPELLNIFDVCENKDLIYEFASTSKISFAGGGLSALAASENNIKEITKAMGISIIGHDKINQLRHVRFFKDYDGIKAHMKKQADIIRGKFEMVEGIFEEELAKVDDVSWSKPKGGYFISLEVKGRAKEVVASCKECGVSLTPSGSAFPYHNDPNNSNIRIAPTCPSVEDLKLAAQIITLCVKIESLKQLI